MASVINRMFVGFFTAEQSICCVIMRIQWYFMDWNNEWVLIYSFIGIDVQYVHLSSSLYSVIMSGEMFSWLF